MAKATKTLKELLPQKKTSARARAAAPKRQKGVSKQTQRARDKEMLSTAAKIISRHKLGRQQYTPEKLAWAYKIFTRRGGEARFKMQTPEQNSELGKKGGIASGIARRKRARLYEKLVKRAGTKTVQELLDAP